MKDYRMAVESYANRKEDYLFHNQGPDHAKVIFENIFRTAEHHIRIAAESLWNDSVVNTSEYISAMSRFLDKQDTKLDILLIKVPEQQEIISKEFDNFYRFLYSHPAYRMGRVQIKCGNGKSFKDSESNVIHFTTADGRMYRLEDDTSIRAATANFNDTSMTSGFEKLFDNVFNNDSIGLTTINLQTYFN